MRKMIVLTTTAAFLAGATAAIAGDDTVGKRLNVPRDQWLSASQIVEKLSAQGYSVKEVEVDDGGYEVEMTKDGVRYDANVHPATGEVLTAHDDD